MSYSPVAALHEAAHLVCYARVSGTFNVSATIDSDGSGETLMGHPIPTRDRAKVAVAGSIAELVLSRPSPKLEDVTAWLSEGAAVWSSDIADVAKTTEDFEKDALEVGQWLINGLAIVDAVAQCLYDTGKVTGDDLQEIMLEEGEGPSDRSKLPWVQQAPGDKAVPTRESKYSAIKDSMTAIQKSLKQLQPIDTKQKLRETQERLRASERQRSETENRLREVELEQQTERTRKALVKRLAKVEEQKAQQQREATRKKVEERQRKEITKQLTIAVKRKKQAEAEEKVFASRVRKVEEKLTLGAAKVQLDRLERAFSSVASCR